MEEQRSLNPSLVVPELGPLDQAPIAVALVDEKGRVLAWNRRATELTGYKPEDVIAGLLVEMIGARNSERFDESFKTFLSNGETTDCVLLHCAPQGEDPQNSRVSRAIEVYFAPSNYEGRYFVYFNDVSSRLCLEKDLRKSKRESQAAKQAKTYFLANMSHEIRTPLSAIVGYVDFLASGDGSTEERWNWSHRIKDNAQHLKRLIDDILDISRMEADEIDVHEEEVDLDALLNHIQQTFVGLAIEKGLKLHFDLDPELPKWLRSDASRMRQVLVNLVGNAIKFTESGEIRLRGQILRKRGELPKVVFDVEDTGPGMTRGEAQRLFKPFMQADVKYTRRYGGTGLGLALSQRLARALHGDLFVLKTIRGKGSVFRFELPLRDITQQYHRIESSGEMASHLVSRPETPNLSGRRVLLVEDSVDNQVLVQRMLSKAGAEVSIAGNGKEGVDMALSGDFNIVLMDIQMPVMDGYQARKRLAECCYDRPVVAFTAHALSSEVDKTKAAGFHAHLTKPINKEKLYRLVADLKL